MKFRKDINKEVINKDLIRNKNVELLNEMNALSEKISHISFNGCQFHRRVSRSPYRGITKVEVISHVSVVAIKGILENNVMLQTDTTELLINVAKITITPADKTEANAVKVVVSQTVKTTRETPVIEMIMVKPTGTFEKINKL